MARDTKLQAFQYKLIHRVIPCNKYLTNIRIKQDETCSYCDSSDTLQHFFYACPPVNNLWDTLSSWLANNLDIHITFNAKMILFGLPRTADMALVLNYLILFTKFYIYRQRLFHQNKLEILHVLHELRLRLRVEKYINTRENKPGKFKKWERFLGALG